MKCLEIEEKEFHDALIAYKCVLRTDTEDVQWYSEIEPIYLIKKKDGTNTD